MLPAFIGAYSVDVSWWYWLFLLMGFGCGAVVFWGLFHWSR